MLDIIHFLIFWLKSTAFWTLVVLLLSGKNMKLTMLGLLGQANHYSKIKIIIYYWHLFDEVSITAEWDHLVCTATGYMLDGRGWILGRGKRFFPFSQCSDWL
jgi:hypothetical protein